MATYCSDAEVTRWLPENLPAAVDSSGERAQYITAASALVDGLVGPRFALNSSYQKFPDTTASPATPTIIAWCASKLAAWDIYKAMQASNLAVRDGQSLFDDAERMLKRIASGEVQITDSAGTIYGTTNVSASTTKEYDPSFTIGGYDADGNLVSDDAGTLDALTI